MPSLPPATLAHAHSCQRNMASRSPGLVCFHSTWAVTVGTMQSAQSWPTSRYTVPRRGPLLHSLSSPVPGVEASGCAYGRWAGGILSRGEPGRALTQGYGRSRA